MLHNLGIMLYRKVQIIKENRNKTIGKIPDRNTLRKDGEVVNKVNSWFVTNQSNETKGVEDAPTLLIGSEISLIVFG